MNTINEFEYLSFWFCYRFESNRDTYVYILSAIVVHCSQLFIFTAVYLSEFVYLFYFFLMAGCELYTFIMQAHMPVVKITVFRQALRNYWLY